MIDSFHGTNRFLSNFWPATVTLDGTEYASVEHAYVAAKTTDVSLREQIRATERPGDVKRFGRKIVLRDGWDDMKLAVMRDLVRQKFQHPELAALLRATAPHELVEGNTWGDRYWGVCRGQGQNNLGKILMAIRDEIAT